LKKILFIFGTRPEAIKLAPLIKEFQVHSNIFSVKVCVTGQHREMLKQVLNFFSIRPDYDLNLMKPNQCQVLFRYGPLTTNQYTNTPLTNTPKFLLDN